MDYPSIDTVYQAICTLHNTNPHAKSEKQDASSWLGEFQKSIHSWKISDELLQQKKSLESYYFAAQTMRSKILHNLSELPPEALISLRDSLIAHLKDTTPDTSPAVLTQLCLALSDLALQMPEWKSCVGDLINSLSANNAFVLLEILTVFPQEIDSSSLALGDNRREDIKVDLRSNSHIVTMLLKESIVTQSQSTSISLKIVKCMTSWIQVRAINMQEVPQNAVIGFCFQVLRDHECINLLHGAALDCICALLHCLEENNNDDSVERLILETIIGLENSYHMAVANEEEEKVSNYARLFTELAESFLEKIVTSAAAGETHIAMRSLELVLVCVGHHDYEVAEISFNLWYRLSEEVYQRDYQPLTDTFKPHIERLITALARHCQCEPDRRDLPDEGDDFYEFRCKVRELVKDVVFIVESSRVFRQMCELALQSTVTWDVTEAALFIMCAVARNIVPEEYEYVPKVVEAILSMPATTHMCVRRTCIMLLGELGEWIDAHPECLECVLQALLGALEEPELGGSAAKALQQVTQACGARCAAAVPALLAAARLPLAAPALAAVATAAAAAVSRLQPDQLSRAMSSAAATHLAELIPTAPSERLLRALDALASLFRHVASPTGAALLPAVRDVCVTLRPVMVEHIDNTRIIERSCRCLRFCVRATRAAAAPVLSELCATISALYCVRPHSALLYLASILVDELWSDPTCVDELINLAQTLLPRGFALLEGENGLRDNPDTVDDLFRLCIRFLQRLGGPFVSCGACEAALRTATTAASLDHRDASSSLCKFVYDVVKTVNSGRPPLAEPLSSLVDRHGAALTSSLLTAALLSLHAAALSDVADVLLELSHAAAARHQDWLRPALAALPTRRARATDVQCDVWSTQVARVEKPKELTRLLRDFARLYR